jgi:hypothetical protein
MLCNIVTNPYKALPFEKFHYKATTRPKNPTAPRIPAATMFVGAAPALLELLEGVVEPEVVVLVTTAVGALVMVVNVLLEYDVVLGDVVAGAVTVELPKVVMPASTSSEAISGIRVAAVIAMPITQDCASGGKVLYHAGKPLTRI